MNPPFHGLRCRFQATLQAVDGVCLQLRDLLSVRLLGPRDLFALELLAREALTNAVRYGCQGDPGREVAFRFRLGRRRAVLVVDDDGPGFDWRAYLARPDDDEATGGRGLRIYRTYASRLLFNPKGNRLLLIRNFPEPVMPDPKSSTDGDKAVLFPGDLTAGTVDVVRAKLKGLLQAGAKHLTVDLAGVQMVDSMGIGLLIQANNSVSKADGTFRVINPSEELAELFRSMRLDKWFTDQA